MVLPDDQQGIETVDDGDLAEGQLLERHGQAQTGETDDPVGLDTAHVDGRVQEVPANRRAGQGGHRLRYAADHRAKVVFIEEGRGNAANTTKLAQSVDYALRKNVVVVAEASRLVTYEGKPTPPESLSYPVALPGVIGVGAIDEKGRPLAKMSARNSTVLLSAPGTRLNVTGDGGQSRWYIYGPPPAAAWVVGTAALIKGKYPKLSPARVAQALAVSVRHRPKGGYDATIGNGILNPVEALKQAARLNRLPGSAPAEQVRSTAHDPLRRPARLSDQGRTVGRNQADPLRLHLQRRIPPAGDLSCQDRPGDFLPQS